MSPEKEKSQAQVLHIKPEGYYSPGDPEFLEQFLQFLRDAGFNVKNLFFSGHDGTGVNSAQDVPRYQYIFGMNEAGWREAIRIRESNPAEYAEGFDTPCIGVYDAGQLCEVYNSAISQEAESEDRVELEDITLGERLQDLPPDRPVNEAVVHNNFPDGSPTDASVAYVFIDQ